MDRRAFVFGLGAAPLATAAFDDPPRGLVVEVAHRPSSRDIISDVIDRRGVCRGFEAGDLVIVAGPRRSGKTSLALSIVRDLCETSGSNAIYWGPHVHEDIDLANACQTLTNMQQGTIHVRCMNEVRGNLISDVGQLAAVVVDDFSSDMRLHGQTLSANSAAVGAAVIDLKQFAVSNNCVVIAIAALGAEFFPDDRPFPRPPRLSDFYPLAQSVQSFGTIVLIHRPCLYGPPRGENWSRIAEIEFPRQCALRGREDVSLLVVLDSESGLYREPTHDEVVELYSLDQDG